MRSWRTVLVLALLLAGAALSLVLLLQHHGATRDSAFLRSVCGEERGGCESVNRSQFSEVGGVSLAALGLLFYVSLALLLTLALAGDERSRLSACALALLFTAFGIVIDLVLLGIQAFYLKTFCRLCLLTYLATIGALLLLWPARRFFTQWRSLAREGTVRLTGMAWMLSSICLALAVGVGELALPASTETSVVPALDDVKTVDAMDLDEARREVKRLRRTLDDPDALNTYLVQKTLRDFDRAAVLKPDVGRAPSLGSQTAPIEIVIFSDFLCPGCVHFAHSMKQYLPELLKQSRVAFMNYPLDASCNSALRSSLHPSACLLALGSVCAHAQNRFEEFHDRAFEIEAERVTNEDLTRIALQSGLDLDAFGRCLRSSEANEELHAQILEAQRLGVHATPTVVVNGRRLERPTDVLITVNHELSRLGLLLPPRTTP